MSKDVRKKAVLSIEKIELKDGRTKHIVMVETECEIMRAVLEDIEVNDYSMAIGPGAGGN